MDKINKNSLFVLFVWVLLIIFISIKSFSQNPQTEKIKYVQIGDTKVKVELAITEEARARGLSEKKRLKGDEGMLFVFERPGIYPFWMKSMKFPIDIIWIVPDEMGAEGDLRMVYIKKNATPGSYPETFAPDVEAKYVLEVVSGFSDENNLKVGDRVELSY